MNYYICTDIGCNAIDGIQFGLGMLIIVLVILFLVFIAYMEGYDKALKNFKRYPELFKDDLEAIERRFWRR